LGTEFIQEKVEDAPNTIKAQEDDCLGAVPNLPTTSAKHLSLNFNAESQRFDGIDPAPDTICARLRILKEQLQVHRLAKQSLLCLMLDPHLITYFWLSISAGPARLIDLHSLSLRRKNKKARLSGV